jgi:hypothetical protein
VIDAFGPLAERYAQGLGDIDLVVSDIKGVGDAYFGAVRRLESGIPFYCMLLADDPRVEFGYRYGEQILAQLPNDESRNMAIEQLVQGSLPVNGMRADAVWQLDRSMEGMAIEFLALADTVLVRSYAEVARLQRWCVSTYPPRPLPPVERILAAATVPAVERVPSAEAGVVVWAPHRPALECALHLRGLAGFQGEVTCVSTGGPLPSHSAANFLRAGDAGVDAALSRAAVIVCSDPTDPSEAIAFARLGYGIVAPLTSGTHEFASNVVAWDALDPRLLLAAVAAAAKRPAIVHAAPMRPPHTPQAPPRPAFIDAQALPLVSMVTPTYNRRVDLRKMLSCLAAQTYPNIEAVIVNDGGAAIDDIVAEFPFARLIEQPANAGALRAVERGRSEARGEYIGLLPDDDWIYPDHIDRMMNAMFRSGTRVAHGAGLLRFLERADDGEWWTAGLNNRTFSQTMCPTDALVSATLGGHQMLVHRSVYDTVGGYILDSDVSDNEIHIRITRHFFYAFVDHVTAEFRDHAGGQNRQCDFPAALREIYDNVHPVTDRPVIIQMRRDTIAHIASREPGKPPFPATLRRPRPSSNPAGPAAV